MKKESVIKMLTCFLILCTAGLVYGKTDESDFKQENQNPTLLGDLAAAEQRAKSAPTPENYLSLSLQLHRNQRYEDSITACRAALKLRPDYAEAFNNIAAAYEALEMWNEAIGAAREALRLKPGFQLAQNNLNWSLSLHEASPTKDH